MKNLIVSLRFILLPLFLIFLMENPLSAQNLQISGGNNFSASLCSDGKVYAWGKNDAGQLGRDATNVKYAAAFSSTPQLMYLPVGNSLTIKQVDAGSGNTGIALACNGSVWEWGGECGNGNIGIGSAGGSCAGTPTDGNAYFSSMQQVLGGAQGGTYLTNISYINESTVSSFVVENGGKVLAWGDNSKGALGNGAATNTGNTYTPSYVLTAAGTPLTGISVVEGSDYSGYALGTNGKIYSWGDNTAGNQELGRPIAGNQFYAAPVKAWDYTLNDGTLVDLSNIVKMTGGDTHGLGIDANGDLWSWGGDWGPGQRGWGATGTAQPYATKVVAPGTACALNQWKFGPWLTGAVDLSAGQQHSIVLLNNGNVVTFGNNSSGQLGIGSTSSSGCPVYVLTAAATPLANIVSVSDGDLWSFALTSSGQVYVWGENTNGELGIPGNTTDQLYAYLNPAIPTACTGSLLGCPVADLGADILKCPNISKVLLAGDNGDTYQYSWYSGPSATGPWTLIGAANRPYAAGVGATITVTTPQFYRVVIIDTRGYVANQCGPCPSSIDIMQITDRTPPVATSSAGTCGTTVCFDINATGAIDNTIFDWYVGQSGGAKLNAAASANPFCTPKAGLTLNGSNYEIWVDDQRTFQSTVGPTTNPCAPTGGSAGPAYQQEFVVYSNIVMTSVDVFYKTNSVVAGAFDAANVKVYSNDPNKNSSSTDGVNALTGLVSSTFGALPRNSSTYAQYTMTGLNLALPGSPAGIKYWLEVSGLSNGTFGEYTCAAAYPYADAVVGQTIVTLAGSTASAQAIQQVNYNALAFNWKFTYQDGYPCGRFLLTAPSGTTACLQPVEFLYFHGENKGNTNMLTWATGSEKNSSYFTVMKSFDGTNWTPEAKVNAAGNSSTLLKYSFNDIVSQSGVVYYQIVETDIDGSTTGSKTISLTSDILKQISIIPNPSNGQFIIETYGLTGMHTSINLYDALGRQVYQSLENFSNGITSKNLLLNNLSEGIYFITITDGNYTGRQKLIIE